MIPQGRLTIVAALLGWAVLSVLLVIVPGTVGGFDGQSMLQVTRSIVEHGDVTVHGIDAGVPGLHGHLYSRFGPGQSVVALPLYLAGRALEPLVPTYYRPQLPGMAASLLPALMIALTATTLMLAAVELGATARGAVVLALVYTFATPAAVYPTQWLSEPLTGYATLTAFYLLLRDRTRRTTWRPLLAAVALALAVSTRIEALLFAPPLVLYALLPPDRRTARAIAVLLPLSAALAGLALYNAVRFGAPLETGYGRGNAYALRDTHPPHSLASFVEGLFGLLLSPGKGLLEYAPPAVLASCGAVLLWARQRAETVALLALILLDLCAHANVLIRWVGGWSWGPRFLVPVLPLILLLLAPLVGPGGRHAPGLRRALAVLAVLGVLVQAPALVLYEPHTYIYTLQTRYPTATITRIERAYIDDPGLSPIIGSWQQLGRAGTWTPPRDLSPARVARQSVTVAPYTWWRLLALQGAPLGPLVLVCALLLAIAAACGWGALWLAGAERAPRRVVA